MKFINIALFVFIGFSEVSFSQNNCSDVLAKSELSLKSTENIASHDNPFLVEQESVPFLPWGNAELAAAQQESMTLSPPAKKKLPSAAQRHKEDRLQIQRVYFKEANIKKGPINTTTLVNDVIVGDYDAVKALHMISKNLTLRDDVDFQKNYAPLSSRLQKLSLIELREMPPLHFVEIMSFFTKLNLIPTNLFIKRWLQVAQEQFHLWSEKEFLKMSIIRREAPMKFSFLFNSHYTRIFAESMATWNTDTMISMFTNEIMANTPFTINQYKSIFDQIELSLQPSLDSTFTSYEIGRGALESLMRGLVVLQSQKHGKSLKKEITNLTQQVISIGLIQGVDVENYSYDPAQEMNYLSSANERIKRFLVRKFGEDNVIIEYKNTLEGIYDPVDFYVTTGRLVLELDGSHHFFYPLVEDGSINFDAPPVLRKKDQTRSNSYRAYGHKIKRLKYSDLNNLNELVKKEGF